MQEPTGEQAPEAEENYLAVDPNTANADDGYLSTETSPYEAVNADAGGAYVCRCPELLFVSLSFFFS